MRAAAHESYIDTHLTRDIRDLARVADERPGAGVGRHERADVRDLRAIDPVAEKDVPEDLAAFKREVGTGGPGSPRASARGQL